MWAAVCDPVGESERGPFVGEVEKRDMKQFWIQVPRNIFVVAVPDAASAQQSFPFFDIDSNFAPLKMQLFS